MAEVEIPLAGDGVVAWLVNEIARHETEAVKVTANIILSSRTTENGALIRNRAYELERRLAGLRAQLFALRVHVAIHEELSR